MSHLSLRKAVAAGALAIALAGGAAAQAQTTQEQTQDQSQCNNSGVVSQDGVVSGPLGIALAGFSMGAINVAAAVPVDLQATCGVSVLGPNQGQSAQQSATPSSVILP